MKITASNLIRCAGLSAVVAGLIFMVVGLIHPPQIVSSVTTGRWTVVHLLTIVMAFFGLLGIAGIYGRQVDKAGWMGLVGYLLLSLWFVVAVGVVGAERLGTVADELGLVYVDAPVLGTKKPAEDGALVVLASGPEAVRDRVQPVFDAIGSRTQWVGSGQEATRLKLVANSWVLSVLEGIAEALSFARSLDLDPHEFLAAVKGGAMDAPYVQLKGNAMLDGQFAPAFALDGMAKDASLMREAAERAGVEVPFVEVAQRYLDRASADGHGDEDMAAIFLAH